MEQLAKDFVDAVFSATGSVLGGLWGLLPWEAQVGVGIVAAVAILFVFNMLKNLGGWPLVGAAIMGLVAFVSGSIGFHKGRAWAEARKPTVTRKPKKRRTLL